MRAPTPRCHTRKLRTGCAGLLSPPLPSGVININWSNNPIPTWMIVRGCLGLVEVLLSVIGLCVECSKPRPIGCARCQVISSSVFGLLTTACDAVGSYFTLPHYTESSNCSAATDKHLCQDSYRSVSLFAFAMAICGLIFSFLVFLYCIAWCCKWCNARQVRDGYTEVQAGQDTHGQLQE